MPALTVKQVAEIRPIGRVQTAVPLARRHQPSGVCQRPRYCRRREHGYCAAAPPPSGGGAAAADHAAMRDGAVRGKSRDAPRAPPGRSRDGRAGSVIGGRVTFRGRRVSRSSHAVTASAVLRPYCNGNRPLERLRRPRRATFPAVGPHF